MSDGPSSAVAAAVEPRSGATSTAVIVASRPARIQTTVDTVLMLMADDRAASGLSAAARTAVPNFECLRKSASATVSTGTMTMTMTCTPRTKMPPISQVLVNGVGNGS